VAIAAGDQRKPPRRVRRRLDPERRRAQLLDAAEAVFTDRDPREVTFEQVAEAAGVSRALVYNYFGDRFGLVAALYLRAAVELDDEVAAAVSGDGPGDERLRRLIRAHLEFASRYGPVVDLVVSSGSRGHPVLEQVRRCRLERLTEVWGDTAAARLVGGGVLALLEQVSVERLAEPGLDLAEATDLVFAVLWPGLSRAPHSPFA
jgi:AcrR family transcriptional regulator